MKRLKTMPRRALSLLGAVVIVFGIVFPVVVPRGAAAAQLQERQVTISSSANGNVVSNIAGVAANPGSGGNGQKTREDFTFKLQTSGSLGSILIQYCDDPIKDDACSMTGIPGFDASHVASIVSQTGWDNNTKNDWTLDTTTDLTTSWNCQGAAPGRTNCIALKRTAAETEGTMPETVTLAFGGLASDYITNPTTDNTPFYARIYTFSDTAYTAANVVDYGTVVASTAQQIDITAKVKEVLNFSVSPIATVPPGRTCTPLSDRPGPTPAPGSLTLGDTNGVLSFTQAFDAHSYFRLSTNTNFGVSVDYSGDTLKNGSNSIAAISSAANFNTSPGNADYSFYGLPQFGLAIDSGDLEGGDGYSFTSLAATAQYGGGAGNIQNDPGSGEAGASGAKFAFDTGSMTVPVSVASSSGPVACDTGSVRYVGNISTATPAGIYTTTITYIATGKY